MVEPRGSLIVDRCKQGDNSGPWEYRDEQQQMYNKQVDACLSLVADVNFDQPVMQPCDANNSFQKWVWTKIVPSWAH